MASFDQFDEPATPYGDSYSASLGEDLEELLANSDETKARILLMGTRRSGKSSIQKVVFHKMLPHETLFLDSTNEIIPREISTSALVQFQLLDFPGNYTFHNENGDKNSNNTENKTNNSSSKVTAAQIFNRKCVLVFVIDAQDEETYNEAVDYFLQVAAVAYKVNPKIEVDILIHKTEDPYLSEDNKLNDIKKSIRDELHDARIGIRPDFHQTSIYDHSIFEGFSKIVHKLISQYGLLENLLNGLIESCGMEKSFLFDVVSKIYVATDSNPVNMKTYELCSDMIDVVIDVSCIYGLKGKGDVLAYDADSASIIKLSNGSVLYLREVNKYLALVCRMRKEAFVKSGLVEYNFGQFKQAIAQLFEAKEKFTADIKTQ